MNIQATPSCPLDSSDNNIIPLVQPDFNGIYALRYICVKHRENNDSFLNGYFSNGSSGRYNVRKLTEQYAELWIPHNKIFTDSAVNGNLIWRVKVLNEVNRSIDYVEVWKNKEILHVLFEDNPDWPKKDIETLQHILYQSGLSAMKWIPYPTVSWDWITTTYQYFLSMSMAKKRCIINTPLKQPV